MVEKVDPSPIDRMVFLLNKNKELLAMNKRDEITDGLYARMRSTGGQRARLYGLAKVHMKGTTPRTMYCKDC